MSGSVGLHRPRRKRPGSVALKSGSISCAKVREGHAVGPDARTASGPGLFVPIGARPNGSVKWTSAMYRSNLTRFVAAATCVKRQACDESPQVCWSYRSPRAPRQTCAQRMFLLSNSTPASRRAKQDQRPSNRRTEKAVAYWFPFSIESHATCMQ